MISLIKIKIGRSCYVKQRIRLKKKQFNIIYKTKKQLKEKKNFFFLFKNIKMIINKYYIYLYFDNILIIIIILICFSFVFEKKII